jgi:hypothetical protein
MVTNLVRIDYLTTLPQIALDGVFGNVENGGDPFDAHSLLI